MKQQNTMPLKKDGKILRRSFDGKTEDFKDKEERSFYTKMLKYYCKGASYMPHGFIDSPTGRKQNYAPVQQTYYYV